MKIQNPILRFLAGFAVLTITPVALVFFLHFVGNLAKPWLERWHLVYTAGGYNFVTSVLYGLTVLYILALIGIFFAVSFLAVRGTGNQFFRPPVEDADEE